MPRRKKYERTEITEKAMNVFWNHGYKGTSMRILEQELGINLYSIYAEYENKEGIFLEALKRYQQLNKNVILKKLLDSDGNLEDIRSFFNDFVHSVKSGETPNGCLFANTAMEFGKTDPQVNAQLQFFFQFLEKTFHQLLEKAKTKGYLTTKTPIDKYVNYLIGCTEGLAVIAKVLEKEKLQDFIDTTLSTLK